MERLTSTPRDGWETHRRKPGPDLSPHRRAACTGTSRRAIASRRARSTSSKRRPTSCRRAASTPAQHVIDKNRFAEFGIPPAAVPAITWAWDNEPPAIYGRFDLIYDGRTPPKLLEYNADTPTALIEASIAQWYWKEDVRKGTDQFNSIHERLVAKWKELKDYLTGDVLHFAALPEQQAEDLMTSTYMRDTAIEAGLTTEALLVGDIGWDPDAHEFVDLQNRDDPIDLQALSVGVDGVGGVRRARARHLPARAVDRADLEDAVVEQGDPRGAVGAVPQPSEPGAGLPRRAARSHVVREEAEDEPRGRATSASSSTRSASPRPAATTARKGSSSSSSCRRPTISIRSSAAG